MSQNRIRTHSNHTSQYNTIVQHGNARMFVNINIPLFCHYQQQDMIFFLSFRAVKLQYFFASLPISQAFKCKHVYRYLFSSNQIYINE